MQTSSSPIPNSVKRLFSALYTKEPAAGSSHGEIHHAADVTDLSRRPGSKADLVRAIGDFFLTHDLHLSGPRLLLVHDMLSGGNAELSHRYEARLKSPLGFNDGWLEAVEFEQALRQSASMDQLVGEFEMQLSRFESSTRDAREATETYGDELAQQIETGPSGAIDTSTLAALAEKMLAHTRQLTATIKSNELDTEKLQQRLEKAKQEAQTDQLTGLPNRRAFEDQFRSACEIARKKRQPLCLAFCDIDNFKKVNDVHGHETGDRVLQLVGGALNHLSKNGGFVSRHGGEEFVLLFNGVPLDKATRQLDAAREQLAKKELVSRDTDQPIGHVSFSAGIVNVMAFENPRDGLQAADAALYRAKHAGKNQILQA
jgi:diguanylate cyclase